jgi:hypothetical protein
MKNHLLKTGAVDKPPMVLSLCAKAHLEMTWQKCTNEATRLALKESNSRAAKSV